MATIALKPACEIPEGTGAFSESEAKHLFEMTAQRYLDMTTEEFLLRWDADRFKGSELEARAFRVAALIPLIREIRAGKKTR
jgi:hypothetical protein